MVFRITHGKNNNIGWGAFLILLCLPVFSQAASLNVTSSMSFGLIEFTTSHQGELLLGTNGSIIQTGSGFFYQGGAVPAQVDIIGDDGTIEFRCSTSAKLGASGSGSLDIDNIEVSVGVGLGPGEATPCRGDSPTSSDPLILDLTNSPNPKLYLGGRLNIPFATINSSQTFDTKNAEGSMISISTVYQ